MDAVSLSANTRSALNNAGSGEVGVTALKIAAQADRAIVAVVEQAAEALKSIPPAGQGQYVDKRA
jgi:NADPH:quinone reductase-like Zn-dependent oxidoreductase